ncbi:MAG: single-stranded-DNA-specific exonuclease [Thermoleophilaceae bacterium]|nr:single-stranded-DNA-specific exonuclease [Thermoleophilaceae bacterium]
MALATARWSCTPYSVAAADRLAEELGLSQTVAAILVRRGFDTVDAARRFLAADERHDPFAFAGIDRACQVILGHVRRGSAIVVHGDYDVDGVCSTAILVNVLRRLGAGPDWHIPSREDGYGLSTATIERLAARGAGLVVTADCAVAAVEEVALARRLGLDVVVTDHHRPAQELPDCPIVHPVVSGYPFPDLCAAGVAHKLAQALLHSAGRDPADADADADLVGLATVADVVPLRGENRRLVRQGVRAIARTAKPGLRALMRIAAVDPGTVDEQSLGFRLAPRINAAGRLARADAALELILTRDETRADEIADELDLLNRQRQDVETRILFAAEAARAEQPEAPAYVLAGQGWHPGVIGIVASRLVERYHRPCVLIALDGDRGRGSGRSISAFDLHAGLAACSPHLLRFGGHRAAAGMEIAADQVDAFRHAFVRHAASVLSPTDLIPVERVDAVVGPDGLGVALAEELQRLRPFGHGNPTPTLLAPAARLGDVRSMGQEAQHARFTIAGGGARARGVAFRTTARSLPDSPDQRFDVAVKLELNDWNGAVEPRLVLRALCPTEPGRCQPAGEQPPFAQQVRDLLEDPAPPGPATVGAPLRVLRDWRGQGFAGVAGHLLSSGQGLAVVCADVDARRAGLEQVIGGVTRAVRDPEDPDRCSPALLSWHQLAAQPELALPFQHLLALDPPEHPDGRPALAAAPSRDPGFAHLAWGPAEAEFALAVARRDLDLRPAVTAVYRALRAAAVSASADVQAALAGARAELPPLVVARALRVLAELELLVVDTASGSLSCRLLERQRTALERSPTYVACTERLAQATAQLQRAVVRAA